MTFATLDRGKLVFVFIVATGKIDYDLRSSDAESALECGYMEHAVESTCGSAVKSDANALEDDLTVLRLEGKGDAARKSEIEKWQAAEEPSVHGDQSGNDWGACGVDDEALQGDICLSCCESEAAGVKNLAGSGVEINRSAGYREVDGAVAQSGGADGPWGYAETVES